MVFMLLARKIFYISILQFIDRLYQHQIFKADLLQLAWFHYCLIECF